jgi:hypothetical protein
MTERHQPSSEIIKWLLDGDPSIAWQVQRDLLDQTPGDYETTRQKITQHGWGKDLLSHQDETGTWGRGLYSPKWISTHYTLICLRRLGLPQDNPQAHLACQYYLDKTFFEPDGGINVHATKSIYTYSETCVTGMTLNFLAYFKISDIRLNRLVEHLLTQQMADGGWNCESYKGATHSSFHTTLSVLEGLLSYQLNINNDPSITLAREKAHKFLLQHHLYKSHRTGEIVDQRMTRFPFPPRWFYDFLKALDYFQAAKEDKDDRFLDAIDLLLKKQNKDQTWSQYRGPSGRTYFDFEQAGKPGRMNTLRAYRVLKWWQA